MTTMSKKAYFDLPDDIFDKYKNKYHRTIKMKPFMLNLVHILNTTVILIAKMLNLK